jgi:hypothetical protein
VSATLKARVVEEEAVGDGVVGSFEMAGRTRLVRELCWPTAFDPELELLLTWSGTEHATTPQPGGAPWA